MLWNILWQLPKILRAIWLEHFALRRLVKQHNIDGILSDNRFGCFSSEKRSVFLTHQVNIQVPFSLGRKLANFFNHLFIHRFDECWVPDVAASQNLSGALSHPVKPFLEKKVKYIGALSQLKTGRTPGHRYTAIAVLSGPEPQRTKLENALIEQAGQLHGDFLIVQGRPERKSATPVFTPKNTEVVSSLTGEALQAAILESEVFIGRSGYSTVMDLARLGKPALLIPTPGQTEQEYLAAKFLRENVFFTQKQNELNLEIGMVEAKRRSGFQGNFFDEKALGNAISAFLRAC